MPRIAANLTMLFNEVPFLDRFEAAAKAGFGAVEFLFPYEYKPAELRARLDGNGLKLVLHNLPPGDWGKGERGIGCHPDRISEFRDGVARAIDYATALGAPQVNCLAGIAPNDAPAEKLRTTLAENLRFAADRLASAGIRLLIEPINFYDIPGFYLNRTAQALELIAEAGSDNLYVQYDIYHMQRMEGELANTIKANLGKIAHMQLADNPGRNEPGTGEINYRFLFGWLDAIGYDGWIGCEYKPKTTTEAGLGWRAAHGL
ncbi:MAG: hydroxypyruvate isomerase [Burkholderiales bacterium]|nr:hydroxypyruvate isomerase [Burkholderiales bacterium]